MRAPVFLIACATVAILSASAAAQEAPPAPAAAAALPVERMREFIARGVAELVAAQQPDGSWSYTSEDYRVGMTALATLALRHSGRTEAIVPAQKGLACVAQHAPEPKTYTAGLVEALLFEAGAHSYDVLMGTYAEMVVRSQLEENPRNPHMWGYNLVLPPRPNANKQLGPWARPDHDARGDNSNTQYAILALYFAQKAGFQIPQETWKRVKELYETTQRDDGAWSYLHPVYLKGERNPEERWDFAMTCVGSVSLYLADEALASQAHTQCRMNPDNPKVMKGIEWLGQHMRANGDGYGWYACERLGILSGRSEYGGKDWLTLGAEAILRDPNRPHSGTPLANTALQILFLARALEPIRINKLQRDGDWNNDPYDAKHLTEFITERYQNPTQWRIVTLEAPVEFLLRVPILYLNGHDALKFTDAEKAKLKEYVNRGGTIFAMACCGRPAFDKSFRDLRAELWPDLKLETVPRTHALFQHPKQNPSAPAVLGMALDGGAGRLGVVYCPYDLCCRWHMGGKRAEPVYAFGINLVYYVDIVASRQGAVKAGYGNVHTGAETPAVPATPATPAPEPARP